MKRVLEKLAAERLAQEEALTQKLAAFKAPREIKALTEARVKIGQLLDQLRQVGPSVKTKKGAFSFLRRTSSAEPYLTLTAELLASFQVWLDYQQQIIEQTRQDTGELIQLLSHLTEARDREWDALGSNHVGIIFKSLEWRVEKLAAECQEAKTLLERFHFLRARLEEVLLALGEKPKFEPAPVKELVAILRDWRYAAFENRFRGPQEEVKKQLESYASLFPAKGKILDLGCGRGEMVELLREKGLEATGVDLNDQMIALCRSKGLPCEKKDLIEALASCADASLAGIFSSQVIEHLAPAVLELMIDLCYLKLAPSGVLILETVNPASVFALVQVYLLDPSHERPIHPQSLRFLLETAGFKQVEIRYAAPLKAERLKEIPGADEKTTILNQNIDALNELLFAPVNYAAIAWK